MSEGTIERPVWRRFRPQWLSRAVLHVRAGGCAAIVSEDGRIDVLLPVDARGKSTELGWWALLSIEQRRWRRVKEGPAQGLASARIKLSYEGAILDWCDRDAVHPDPTREVALDCTACAACCHDATVLLEERDLDRFRAAGRKELAGRAYIKRSRDGRVVLRFAEGGRCQHLRQDNLCSIYAIRPDNCRAFVAGSEACLSAREETLGIRDGAPVEAEQVEVVQLGEG